MKASDYIRDKFNGQVVYGDTDSTMIVFREKEYGKLWSHCEKVAAEVSALFPRPMELEFEETIYKKFFILTKKRYIALECDNTGEYTGKITKKGILLARRDNSRVVRDIYEKTIMHVLHNSTPDISSITDSVTSMFHRIHSPDNYVITKSVGDVDGYVKRDLPTDEKKKQKRLRDLRCTESEYEEKCLPAHIQLCQRMRRRGVRVDVGSRMEYVITTNGDRLSSKVEDIVYFKKFSGIMDIDSLYYLGLLVNPLDQIINVTYPIKDIVSGMFKIHTRKRKICEEIKRIGQPIINY